MTAAGPRHVDPPRPDPAAGADVLSALEEVAGRIAGALGFATVAINLYRPAWDDFQVVVVHGVPEARAALMHSTGDAADWEPMLQERFRAGGAYFIPNGTFDWSEDEKPSFVPDMEISDDPDAWHPEDALFVPLLARDGRLFGVLSVDQPLSGRRPGREELEALAAVAQQASLAIEAAQLAEAASRQRAALVHLLGAAAQVTNQDDVVHLLGAVCAGVHDALGFERVVLWLEAADGAWTAAAAAGWTAEERSAFPRLEGEDVADILRPEVERHGCVLLADEEARRLAPPRVAFYESRRNGRGPHAWSNHWLLVPMRDRAGRLVGALWVDDPLDYLKPAEETLHALRAFANQAMSALEREWALERERHLAEHDPLTGLRNRRNLHQAIDAVIAEQGDAGVALLVCDIDTFKRINDVLGYDTGDAVLRDVADVLREAPGEGGIAARLGGEEFALVLPGHDEAAAIAAAERVRAASAERAGQVPWGLTLSVGVAVSSETLPSAEALLRAAGRALVAAKRLGRDRVVPYDRALDAMLGTLEDRRDSHEQQAAMIALAETVDLRDERTARHSSTVGAFSEAIARELGWAPERVERMRVAGILHDLGKLGVADAVLHKAGPLTPDEWTEMRRHSELGARILEHAGLRDVARWVLHHHERWDGGGYPTGLAGDDIPPEARILAVADAYEAMTAVRTYRQDPLSPGAAREELRRQSGAQFAAPVVEAFLRVLQSRPDTWARLAGPAPDRREVQRD